MTDDRASPRLRAGLLEAMVPGLSGVAPRVALATLPTPVERLPSLASELGLADLMVKRDDATSPLFGGTKVRGLEFFLARALSEGRNAVATLGSEGSNHVLATAVLARELGLARRVVLFPHPDRTVAERNVRRLESVGATVTRASWPGVLPAIVATRLRRREGRRPFWIAPGGSSGLGVLGAVEGALEVVAAARAGAIAMPEDVVVAAGSCGTAAGLALGFALEGAVVRVVAVRVVPRVLASRRRILRLAGAASSLLAEAGLGRDPALGPVAMVHEEAGRGYARPTERAEKAVTIAHGSGIQAETTYTGKAWAHLISGAFRARKVLFWNTFGSDSRIFRDLDDLVSDFRVR